MPTLLDRPYVFSDARSDVQVVPRGGVPPERGTLVDMSRLRRVLFDDRNAWEKQRLLRALQFPDLRPGALDLSERTRVEDRLFRVLDRQFSLYEVARPIRQTRLVPIQWFPPAKASRELSWIGVWLVDQSGKPVPGRPYRVVAPDGQTTTGSLDDQGSAQVKRIPPGSCHVSCPDVQPRGSLTYTVRPGDHASGIALSFGIDDYLLVWNRPENADLKALRSNPHELVEGDQVFVPQLVAVAVTKAAGADYVFILRQSPLKLRIALLGVTLEAIDSETCTLDGVTKTTDSSGTIEVDLDKTSRKDVLMLGDLELDLAPGAMPPVDEPTGTGWIARLYNLGFLLDPGAADGDDELDIALSDFQAQYGLPVTGSIDDSTRDAIESAYGC